MLATKLVSTTAARTKAAMSSKMMAMEAMVGFGVAEWTECLAKGPFCWPWVASSILSPNPFDRDRRLLPPCVPVSRRRTKDCRSDL